jgi:hypothetical protein
MALSLLSRFRRQGIPCWLCSGHGFGLGPGATCQACRGSGVETTAGRTPDQIRDEGSAWIVLVAAVPAVFFGLLTVFFVVMAKAGM